MRRTRECARESSRDKIVKITGKRCAAVSEWAESGTTLDLILILSQRASPMRRHPLRHCGALRRARCSSYGNRARRAQYDDSEMRLLLITRSPRSRRSRRIRKAEIQERRSLVAPRAVIPTSNVIRVSIPQPVIGPGEGTGELGKNRARIS